MKLCLRRTFERSALYSATKTHSFKTTKYNIKPFTLILLLFITVMHAHAQQLPPPPAPVMTDTTDDNETDSLDFDKEFKTAQIEAKFPGGRDGWISFLERAVKVNTPVKHKATPGLYIVEASFLVIKQVKYMRYKF